MAFKPIFLRSANNYDMDAASNETALHCKDESLTVQSAAEECDINTIVRRFGITGELPSNVAMPVSGDFTGVVDFHGAMNLVRQAQEEFLRVPAEVRARFLNDPGRFIEFFDDPANADEAKKLGLLREPVAPPAPLAVRVVPDGA